MITLIIHIIQPGDTIYKIAQQFGISADKIIADNGIEDATKLMIGQSLVIDNDIIKYTIQKGDTIFNIAKAHGVSINDIMDANPGITNPNLIYTGQIINIPINLKKLGTIDVGGYAFPQTSLQVLSNILPCLTYLPIFSYQVQEDGRLNQLYETDVLNAAIQQRVMPKMTITNIRADEGFDSDLAHNVLVDPIAQNRLIENIINIFNTTPYKSLNIDFEYIYQNDREAFNQFLRNIVTILHPLGYTVSTALAPKVHSDQQGILYEAHQYEEQGKIVDQIWIMTYEWGYTYGPPMAVSPIDQVERVLKYAVSVIPSTKIMMGLPNYAYDWTLPFVKGNRATSMSLLSAINLAVRMKVNIQFDDVSQTPFFEYTDPSGQNHIVWFDDARSIDAKLRLVKKYNLAGIFYWNVNTYFPANWVVLRSLYNINKII